MIVLIGGEKGGTGKTTIATNIAVMRQKADGDMLLVDSDPQPNASAWCVSRDHNKINPRVLSIQKTGKNTHSDIKELKNKYRNILIDTGGRDAIELRAGLLVANVAVIPLRPSQFDLWTLAKLNDMVGEIKDINPSLRAIVCLNQVHTNPRIKESELAKEFFESSDFKNIKLASTIIYERVAYRKVAAQGMTIHEARIDYVAEDELSALYSEIYNNG